MRNNPLRARLLPCLAAVLAAALPAAAAAQGASPPDYASFTATGFVPYANANRPPFDSTLAVDVSIDGAVFRLTMDTGSTGIVLPAFKVPGWNPDSANNYPVGWEFLSSSKRLWVGRWVQKDVVFRDSSGARLTARVPILAVEHEVEFCPGYVGSPNCPGVPFGPPRPEISYMGIGFGREHDGQTQGTPDKNPFLNIVRIDGDSVRGTMRSGYIVTERGVHLGLTGANTAGFALTPLSLNPCSTAPGDLRQKDWTGARICVSVDGSPCVDGAVLIDTGIDQMYLTVPPDTVPVDTVYAQDKSVPSDTVPVLTDSSVVRIQFPDSQSPVAWYSFKVGNPANVMQPTQVIRTSSNAPTFVNTGRHFFRNFQVLFDSDGGWFGLKWTGPANSPYGGSTPASP